MVFVQSFSYVSLSLLVLDLFHPDFPLLLRSHHHSGFLALVLGLARLGFVYLMLVIDTATPDPPLFAQSLAWLGSSLLIPDCLRLGFFMSSKSFTHLEFAVLAFGLSCAGFVFALLVVSVTHPGSLMLSRSMCRSDLPTLSFDSSHVNSLLPLQGHSCCESLVSTLGITSCDSMLSASDFSYMGSSSLMRSSACLDLAPSAVDLLHLGFVVLLRSLMWSDSMVLVFGLN